MINPLKAKQPAFIFVVLSQQSYDRNIYVIVYLAFCLIGDAGSNPVTATNKYSLSIYRGGIVQLARTTVFAYLFNAVIDT